MLEGRTTAVCGSAQSASIVTTVATVKDAPAIVVITPVVEGVVIAVLDMELDLELNMELDMELDLKVMELWVNLLFRL